MKWYNVLFSIVFLFGAFLSIYMLNQHNNFINKNGTVQETKSVSPIYGTEKCYISDKYIYLFNEDNGILNIFNLHGKFVKGFKIFGNGGTYWSGMGDKMHIYAIRPDIQVDIEGTKYSIAKNVVYDNEEVFVNHNNINNFTECKIEKNAVTYMMDDMEFSIVLDVHTSFFSIDMCIVILSLCVLGFLICSGMLKKVITDQTEPKRIFPSRKI